MTAKSEQLKARLLPAKQGEWECRSARTFAFHKTQPNYLNRRRLAASFTMALQWEPRHAFTQVFSSRNLRALEAGGDAQNMLGLFQYGEGLGDWPDSFLHVEVTVFQSQSTGIWINNKRQEKCTGASELEEVSEGAA